MSKTELHTYRNCDSSEESMRKKKIVLSAFAIMETLFCLRILLQQAFIKNVYYVSQIR